MYDVYSRPFIVLNEALWRTHHHHIFVSVPSLLRAVMLAVGSRCAQAFCFHDDALCDSLCNLAAAECSFVLRL